MDEKPDVLPYARPIEPEPKRPYDKYCVAAFLVSLVSCAFPLIGAAAIGLAIYGLIRRRKTQSRGRDYAVGAIVFSVVGTLAFIGLVNGASKAKATSLNVSCMSNLRQIGADILMYENEYRDARGYGLADVVTFAWPAMPQGLLQCPSAPISGASKPAPTPLSSYVLLTALEPFASLKNAATTIIAFELSPHHVPAYDGFAESDHINVLYGDGHVESLPLDKAAAAIEKSLLAQHRLRRE